MGGCYVDSERKMEPSFNDNVYLIDLSYVRTAAEIIYDLSTILDNEEAKNKEICLKLGKIDLNQSQIMSIKSLISSINSTLLYIDTNSVVTEEAARNIGLIISSKQQIQTEPPVSVEEQEIAPVVEETIEEEPEAKEHPLRSFTNALGFVQENQYEDETQEETPVLNEEITEEVSEEEDEDEEPQIPSTPREYEKLEVEKTEQPQEENVQGGLDTIFKSEHELENVFDEVEEKQEDNSEIEEHYTDVTEETEDKSYTEEDFELDAFPTKYIKQTVRSGQVINYEGNIVVIGDCHPGSELDAKGDITVWGVLSGIAHAGASGNTKAKIRALKMNAIQLRIAHCYARRPDALNTIFAEKTNSFTPEEARVVNDEIVIFKIND